MTDFIDMTDDGERFTCKMPPDETIVEVRLHNGTIRRAWYSCNIIEAGDYDFIPVEPGEDEPDFERHSIADQVAAWKHLGIIG